MSTTGEVHDMMKGDESDRACIIIIIVVICQHSARHAATHSHLMASDLPTNLMMDITSALKLVHDNSRSVFTALVYTVR